MSAPIKDRPLSASELERLRLILSTFRDGSGQIILKKTGASMPGFRDFERAVAVVCGGRGGEDKGIFDVVVPVSGRLPYGISCKMSSSQPIAQGSSFMELSNSAAKFRSELERLGIDWRVDPASAGPAVVDLVESWHRKVAAEVDLPSSRYLVLSHNKAWSDFQVLCYALDLHMADPRTQVRWEVEGRRQPTSLAGYISSGARRHRLWQFYPNSGGQLKYYPPLSWAEWRSPVFQLEQPPVKSLLERVEEYFPGRWPT